MTTRVSGTPVVAGQGRRSLWACAALLLGFTSPVFADAIIVFDNFGQPMDSFATFSGQLMNNLNNPPRDYDIGNAFIPSASGYVSDLWVAFNLQSGPNEVDLWLMTDNNGTPGQVLEAWHASGQMGFAGDSPAQVYFAGDRSTFIQEGQQYWLVSSSPLPTVSWWMHNDIGDFGPVKRRINGGSWQVWSDQRRGAFRVAVVPEPATLCLLAGASVMLVTRHRRK